MAPGPTSASHRSVSTVRLVIFLCTAQVLVQIGAFTWPALLPGMMPLWKLSNSEAGWVTSAFYGAYLLAVPILVTLTDRIDPKRIYLCGVALTVVGHGVFAFAADGFWDGMLGRALAGIGWAGTYMTGVKLLADRIDGRLMSRAVAGHAAGIGISGALSFIIADLVSDYAGWRMAFALSAATALLAWLIVALFVPKRAPRTTPPPSLAAMFDFGPVFRNTSAMAYALVYAIHTLEMSALRGWGVAFLAFVTIRNGTAEPALSPTMVATALGLIGALASLSGNELATRYGRRRLIFTAMLGSILIGSMIGFVAPLSYPLAVALMFVYGLVIWLDSSSLTAGTAGSAEPSRRGATLAVHSMLGYTGGFIGPLIIGWTLDAAGANSPAAWGMAFAAIALLMVLALAVFTFMRPRGLPGDRDHDAKPD